MNDRLIRESDALKAVDRRIEELSQDPVFVRKNGNIDVMGVKKYIRVIPTVNISQRDVDAVDILMREMHNLDQGYITIGEFDERIEPLRHLCYGRPQGVWIPMKVSSGQNSWKCSVCGRRARSELKNLPYCHCGAYMGGRDDEKST